MYYLRRLGPAGVLAVMASTIPPLGSLLLFYNISAVSHWLRSHLSLGPVIFAGAFIFLGGLNLLPTYVYSALGGWAFGMWIGLASAMTGIVLASVLGYGVGRVAAGERVVKILEEQPKWRAVYDELLHSGFFKTLWIVFLLRVPPNSPFALSNLVLAAGKTQPLAYFIGTLFGMLPRTALVVWLGAQVGGDEFSISEQKWVFWVGLVAAFAVIIVIGQMAKRAMARVVDSPTSNARRENMKVTIEKMTIEKVTVEGSVE